MEKKMLIVGVSPLATAALSESANKPISAKDKDFMGAPQLMINGQPQVLLSFQFMSWSAAQKEESTDPVYLDQVRLAAQAGIHHHHFGYKVPWPREGEPVDYAELDRGMTATIEADPEALMTLRIQVGAPQWWLNEHPDERTTFDDGTKGAESVCSELWLDALLPKLAALVKHAEAQWGDRVVCYFPSAQHSGEWFYPGVWADKLPGFAPVLERAFRRYVAVKYPTPAQLSRAWGRQVSSFDEVTVPSFDERLSGRLGEFFHPALDHYQIDFFNFMNDAMVDAIAPIAATIKQACGRRKPVMFFYGYLYELAECPAGANHSGHLRMDRILRNPDIDMLASPISYFDREPGGAGHFMVSVDSVAAHGKLWVNEDDIRTYLSDENDEWSRCSTLEESQAVHQRNFAQIFPRRMGCWYMDQEQGWLNGAGIWGNIRKLKQLWEQHLHDPVAFAADIAVITDERSPVYSIPNSVVSGALLGHLRSPLARIGAPVGWWLLEDFLARRVTPAKLYIFTNAFVLTRTERTTMREILKEQAATAVWFYAPGFIDPQAGDAGNHYIEQLTGIPVQSLAEPREDLLEPVRESPLSVGVTAPFGSHQKNLRNQWALTPAAGVQPIATYAGDDSLVGAAVSEQDGWRSVYVASLYAPPALLHSIARDAGVWLYCHSDDVVLGDGQFLSLHASSDGGKLLRLPKPAVVRDCLTGDEVAHGCEARLQMKKGETRLLWVEYSE